MARVVEIPDGIEIQAPARLRDRQEDSGVEIAPGNDRMHVHALFTLIVYVIVADRCPGVPIKRHAGKCDTLEGVQDFINLRPGGFVLGRPGNDGMQLSVLELQAIGYLSDKFGITAQDLHARPLAL